MPDSTDSPPEPASLPVPGPAFISEGASNARSPTCTGIPKLDCIPCWAARESGVDPLICTSAPKG